METQANEGNLNIDMAPGPGQQAVAADAGHGLSAQEWWLLQQLWAWVQTQAVTWWWSWAGHGAQASGLGAQVVVVDTEHGQAMAAGAQQNMSVGWAWHRQGRGLGASWGLQQAAVTMADVGHGLAVTWVR